MYLHSFLEIGRCCWCHFFIFLIFNDKFSPHIEYYDCNNASVKKKNYMLICIMLILLLNFYVTYYLYVFNIYFLLTLMYICKNVNKLCLLIIVQLRIVQNDCRHIHIHINKVIFTLLIWYFYAFKLMQFVKNKFLLIFLRNPFKKMFNGQLCLTFF